MSVIFNYNGRVYASLPVLPLKKGCEVLIVFKSVGLIRDGMQYIKQVGSIVRIIYPADIAEHSWWELQHTPEYVKPKETDILIVVRFQSGVEEMFLVKDMVNLCWLPTDTLPSSDELAMFTF